MINSELKKSLQQQASTFSQDIKDKMIYLQSDKSLSSDYYQYSSIIKTTQKSSLENAFSHPHELPNNKKSENSDINKSIFNENQSDFQKRRDNIFARIQALKGKSLPGSYLRTSS